MLPLMSIRHCAPGCAQSVEHSHVIALPSQLEKWHAHSGPEGGVRIVHMPNAPPELLEPPPLSASSPPLLPGLAPFTNDPRVCDEQPADTMVSAVRPAAAL
jgi:hypothetical protein